MHVQPQLNGDVLVVILSAKITTSRILLMSYKIKFASYLGSSYDVRVPNRSYLYVASNAGPWLASGPFYSFNNIILALGSLHPKHWFAKHFDGFPFRFKCYIIFFLLKTAANGCPLECYIVMWCFFPFHLALFFMRHDVLVCGTPFNRAIICFGLTNITKIPQNRLALSWHVRKKKYMS